MMHKCRSWIVPCVYGEFCWIFILLLNHDGCFAFSLPAAMNGPPWLVREFKSMNESG